MTRCEGLEAFLEFCEGEQPKVPGGLDLYFEGVTVFPPEREALLQAYLYFSIADHFPSAGELVLFERPPDREGHQDKGKVDMVYLTEDGRLLVIETKYFLPKYHSRNEEVANRNGRTKRRKKNGDRNKVVRQALENRRLICEEWGIPQELVLCAVFTNDLHMEERAAARGLGNGYVRTHALDSWQRERLERMMDGQNATRASSRAPLPAPPIS